MHSVGVRLPHPRTGEPFDSPVPARVRLARGSGGGRHRGGDDGRAGAVRRQAHRVARRAGRGGQRVPGVPAAGGVARARRRGETPLLRRRAVLGQAGAWLRVGAPCGAGRSASHPLRNGANRTGRVFTGDRSGDFLFAALHRAGLATSPLSVDAADGLVLNHTRVVAAVRCAPPDNAPTPDERSTCAPWLDAEWRLVGPDVRVIVVLGGFAWRAALDMVRAGGGVVPVPQPKFGHLAMAQLNSLHGDVDPARVLSPQPAEHVHRPTHPGDARRRLRRRPPPRLPPVKSQGGERSQAGSRWF